MANSEHIETVQLSNWLKQNKYMYSKIPSETYTKSWNQKRKNTTEGVAKGVPDMMIILKRGSLLFVELKKEKGPQGGLNGSKIYPEQEKWVEALGSINNVSAKICHGFEEAKQYILSQETHATN